MSVKTKDDNHVTIAGKKDTHKKQLTFFIRDSAESKWMRGSEQGMDTYEHWWSVCGSQRCSFCNHFTGRSCASAGCPLHDKKGCANEWRECDAAVKAKNHPRFVAGCSAFYYRIHNLHAV